MTPTFTSATGFARSVHGTDRGRVRADVAFLASRWVQAPIYDRREADT